VKLSVLSRNAKLYSTSRLVEEATAAGHETRVIDTLKCYMDITSANPSVWYRGEKLERQDAVIPRIGASITNYGTAVIRQFEMMDTYCLTGFNSPWPFAFKIAGTTAAVAQGSGHAGNGVRPRCAQHPRAD